MSTAITIDQGSFEFLRKLVLDHSAIALEPNKKYLLESRLTPLLSGWGLGTLTDLVARLRGLPYGDLHCRVVEAMTTNETSFFRDIHPFDALRTVILPPILEKRASQRTLNIWSAACSSGQEPYTISILLREHFPMLSNWKVQIFATDLSNQILDRAKSGTYSQIEVNRGLPAGLLVKYFQKSGLHWQLNADVRNTVQFLQMNLIERWPTLPTMDIIFIRNVLIYFEADTKRAILQKIQQRLAPDGTLFLGGAESTYGICDAFERVNHGKTSTYRLASATPK